MLWTFHLHDVNCRTIELFYGTRIYRIGHKSDIVCQCRLFLHRTCDYTVPETCAFIDKTQYMLIFGATANCIPWVYVPEILPLHARAKGSAIATSSNWLWVRL